MTTDRKILAGFVTCALILSGVAVLTWKNNNKFIASNAGVDHTNQVIRELVQILGYTVDAETGTRGFIITDDEAFLEPYTGALANLSEHIPIVKNLTKDNPVQQQNITELEKDVEIRLNYLENQIARMRQDPQSARTIVASGEGKRQQEKIRKRIEEAMNIELGLLAERKDASDADARNFTIIFIILFLIILAVLVGVYLLITSNLRALRKAEAESAARNWLLSGNAALNEKTRGEKGTGVLARDVISQLATWLNAQVGTVYLAEGNKLIRKGSYALENQNNESNLLLPGQGLPGQALADQKPIVVTDVPADYLRIRSGLGSTRPGNIIVFPFLHAGEVKGVIELGTLGTFPPLAMQYLELVGENIGIAFQSAESRARMQELLEETQAQSEELQAQQEELRQVNEELEEHTQNLKQQQEELQMTNEELEEQTQALELKNKEVEAARKDIEQKSRQIELTSKYKSEFLANMSHELRTPLNSLLILSKDLSENKKQNLLPDQVESAEIIYKSGHDLLLLINEVLDLAKVEAGMMTLVAERVNVRGLLKELHRDLKPQANQKGLGLEIIIAEDQPEYILTDPMRLRQILKNLLSNALKFTETGQITIRTGRESESAISISVTDTGIGIAAEKQAVIFEAFQQADGGTSRKYGGTGLGLSISRELAKLLGGEIRLKSKPGEGSTFTLMLPLEMPAGTTQPIVPPADAPAAMKQPGISSGLPNQPAIGDDRNMIAEGDKVLLVIEDDLRFAGILLKQAQKKGFRCLVASTGEDGLQLAAAYKPHAIILDLELPGINGLRVMAELKANPALRHIPVHIISVTERSLDPIREGAVDYLTKPVDARQLDAAFNRIENFISRRMKNLLIVEDDAHSRFAIRKLIGNGDVQCLEAGNGSEALAIYTQNQIDCIVLDIGLPDMSGFELLGKLAAAKEGNLAPVIVYTGKELTREENQELEKYAESIIIKGVKSEERLLDETALFLHRTISNLPEGKQRIIASLYDRESIFRGKKILLADDDMRNLFALSKILKNHQMEVIKAENGQLALEALDKEPGMDLVLMDIMMPVMDGYEAMRRIRAQARFRKLPIIAITAKAMKDDKLKCLEAGANEYIPKPVEVERLLSLMRVWLGK